jgi:CubicO group peptidase (beta-lactamase class C family)
MDCGGKPMPPRAQSQQRSGFKVGPESAGLPPYWPTMGWKMEAPDKLGLDPAKLETAVNFEISGSTSQAVLIVRHGYVAVEEYFGGFSATQQHESFSMAKSFSSALVGIAIDEGKISSTDYKLCEAYPMQWDCSDMMDPRSRITIEHAMNLTTGLRWREDWRSNATGTNDTIAGAFDMVGTVLSREAVDEPGTKKRYSTGDPALLTGPIQQGTGMNALAYAKSKIFDVIGTPGINWNSDSMGRTTTFAGLQATAQEYAKFGYLYLNRGMWDGKQVVPAEWIDRTTIAQKPCEDWNQWLWHVNMPARLSPQDINTCEEIYCSPTEYVDLPGDGYFAEGINGQFIFIIPSADIVAVRLGQDSTGSEGWDEFARGFLLALMDSIVP